ncbi:SRPBCC family protein [Ureibacillus aquaedulcis]|uniref:SRPBCC family protein n=1 Tax=Ureibacillus aquaedulcis TaxID=3058421 RepID=A0ABT8GTJ5_9BACL|nr:SRPBCC family protein [Ureibacillus sp. BA0131]MDN4494740.1 SRPBCC family protein [Ureibacillus sp. BA0131]
MVDVFTEIIINRPVEDVSDYAANPDHAPSWYVNIHSVQWHTPKPMKVGSQIAFKAKFLGRELAYIYEIKEYIPGEKLMMKTVNGPFPMETIYTWEAIDRDRTRMSLRNKGVPSGFSKILTPFLSPSMKRANQKDLLKLKYLLEKC